MNISKKRNSRQRRRFLLTLIALVIFGVGGVVWAATTIQTTVSRPASLDSGLVAHYTFDGLETDVANASGGDWTEMTPSAAFGKRGRTQAFLSYDNKLWLIGGWDGNNSLAEVWSSSDGTNWSLVTNTPAFGAKATHESLVFDDKMWLIEGGGKSVWYSTDGETWTRSTSNAPWSGSFRNQFAATVFDGKMWMAGGTIGDPTVMNDVWSSSDGASWTQATASAGWSARQNHQMITYDGKLWVIGGNDRSVWYSSDGASWTQATSDGGWGGTLTSHRALTYDNKMWVIGGFVGGTPTSGVWWSEDGANWTQATSNPGFVARAEHGITVHNGRMWVVGGLSAGGFLNDVWSSSIPSTNQVSDSSGNGHHGTHEGFTRRSAPGRVGQALDFDGATDYILVGDTSATAQTISFWMKRKVANISVIRLSSSASVSVNSSGNITTTGISSPTIYVDGSVGAATSTGWHHIVITSSTPISVSDLQIGRNGASYFSGVLDDVRLYSATLTPAQIDRVYHVGATTKIGTTFRPEYFDDRLVAHWSFDANDMDYVPSLPERVLEDIEPISPNEDGTSGGAGGGTFNLVGCGPEFYDCLNDSERYPGTPDTSTGYVELRAQSYAAFYQETIPSIDRVTGVDVYVYHSEPSSHWLWVELQEHNGTPSTIISSTQLERSDSPHWSKLSRTGLSLSQADLDNLSLNFECKKQGGGNPMCTIYSAYIDVTYEWTAPPVPSSGLVFDTKGGFDGAVSGAEVGVGRVGQAMYFDGIDQGVTVGAGPIAVNTVSFWVNPTSATQGIMQLNNSTNITLSSGSISANGFSSPTIYVDGAVASTLTLDKWQFVTITSSAPINASNVVFGSVGSSYFEGAIDDVRMYNAVLTADEISRKYHFGATSYFNKTITNGSLSDGLVAHWSFDGPTVSGSTVSDASTNSNSGTFSGGPGIAIGKIGQGAVFDAAGTLRAPYHSSLNPTSALTYAAWIKWGGHASQLNSLQNIISNGSWNRSLRITESGHWNGSERLVFNINIGGTTREIYSLGVIIPREWTHVAATYDGSAATLYINGEVSVSTAYSGTVGSGTGYTDIGSENNSGSRFRGLIDDVRIYDRALSAEEVARRHQFGK